SVVLPWSTWPIVPMLRWGFVRWYCVLAMMWLHNGWKADGGRSSARGRHSTTRQNDENAPRTRTTHAHLLPALCCGRGGGQLSRPAMADRATTKEKAHTAASTRDRTVANMPPRYGLTPDRESD